MLFILVLAFVGVLALFPTVRCGVRHPLFLIVYLARDFFTYFVHRVSNTCPTGELVAFVGLFGRGKTLSAVHKVVSMYNAYNDKMVWCPRRQKLVQQKVHIISNVRLNGVPFDYFTSLQQIVDVAKTQEAYDDEHDVLTCTLVLGDEFSTQMNSRAFKTNIDPLFLSVILTCRHFHMSLYYTAQRFHHVDALLRQVTSAVIECDKIWRFQCQAKYSAWDLENATNSRMVSPYSRSCWFVRNRDFELYDTLAVVERLSHDVSDNQMLSENEILELQRVQSGGMDAVSRPSKQYYRRQRRTQSHK